MSGKTDFYKLNQKKIICNKICTSPITMVSCILCMYDVHMYICMSYYIGKTDKTCHVNV